MKNYNIYKIGLIVMVIINGVMIFLFVQRPPFPPPSSKAHKENPLMDKISGELGLTSQQKERYVALAKAHRMNMTEIERGQRKLVRSYFELLKMQDTDQEGMEEMLNEIQQFERAKLTLTFQHFEDLKMLCNEEQQDRFELIMDEVLKVLVSDGKNLPPPPRD